MTIVVSIAAIAVLHTRHDATQSIASVAQPSLVHASNAYASFSDADATASIAFLTGDLDLVNGRKSLYIRFEERDGRPSGNFADGWRIGRGREQRLRASTQQLPAYTGLVESGAE